MTGGEGYSSYGNQIGLPSGLVEEIYHPGWLRVGSAVNAAESHVAGKCGPIDLGIFRGRTAVTAWWVTDSASITESAQTSGRGSKVILPSSIS